MIKKIISVISAAVLLLGIADISAFAQGNPLGFLSDCNNTGIEVSAASAILIEADTGTVLFLKNEKEHRHHQDNDCSADS